MLLLLMYYIAFNIIGITSVLSLKVAVTIVVVAAVVAVVFAAVVVVVDVVLFLISWIIREFFLL